jgi:hypothetical protein
MRADPYRPTDADAWNAFVATSKNGTFLHDRHYMDYHADRFRDCSMIVRDGETIAALLPANRDAARAVSHQGLTYGGVISSSRMTVSRMLTAFDALVAAFRAMELNEFYYKAVPRIYQAMPSDEDLYALSRLGAELVRRDIASVVDLAQRAKPRDGRRQGGAKAAKAGVSIVESRDWAGFWRMLEAMLAARHDSKPVHSLAEIKLLAGRFPANIRLFVAMRGEDMQGGAVIYETPLVARTQYIAATDAGRETGALDLLFLTLLDQAFAAKRYFDFGASLDASGELNLGLLDQKEGFGGRAVAQDQYRLRF